MVTKYIVQAHEDGKWKAIYRGDDPAKVQSTYHEACGYVGEDNVRALKAAGTKEDGTTHWVAILVPEAPKRWGLYNGLVDGLYSFWTRRGHAVSRREVQYFWMPFYIVLTVVVPLLLVVVLTVGTTNTGKVVAETDTGRKIGDANSETPAAQLQHQSPKAPSRHIAVDGPPAELAFLEGLWSDKCKEVSKERASFFVFKWDKSTHSFAAVDDTYLGNGEYAPPTKFHTTFELSGSVLTQSYQFDDGSGSDDDHAYYEVRNQRNSKRYYDYSADPSVVPQIKMTQTSNSRLTMDTPNYPVQFRCRPAG